MSASVADSQIRLTIATRDGFAYQVQSNPVPNSVYWRDALDPVAGNNGQTSIRLNLAADSGFFRVLEWDQPTFWYDWRYYDQSTFLSSWGFVGSVSDYVHVDRPYDWYVDQADTGRDSSNNCGPSSVAMAMKWFDPQSTKTAEEARRLFPRGGGWWYTSDIINYFNHYAVPNVTSAYTYPDQLMEALQRGCLVVLCINTAYLTTDFTPEHRVGRFYSYNSGHILVLKGYRRVDSTVCFETYDPNNWHAAYQDQSPKGKNRHFLAGDLNSAITQWWSFFIVIPPPAAGGGDWKTAAASNTWLKPVNPANIPHAGGM